MHEVTSIKTHRDFCKKESVNHLRWAIDQIENGEGLAVTGILEDANGEYQSFGGSTMSRLQTAGALMELAMERLSKTK
jgi:hypothetical protein